MAEETPLPKPNPILEFCFVRAPYLITGMIFLAAALINIANVIGRYVFSAPIFWAEEVLVFMVIWAVFLSAISITSPGCATIFESFSSSIVNTRSSSPDRLKRILRLCSCRFTNN